MIKIKNILIIFTCVSLIGVVCVYGINAYIKNKTQKDIITLETAINLNDIDCIVVLGCKVYPNGVLSDMLKDRVSRGIELYNSKVSPKLLMSGDHGREEYNEVEAMKQAAVNSGVESTDIFMDHAGFSTYESIYRAKEIFGADKIVIVTQRYHLYRALYIAEQLGIEAYGVESDLHIYQNQSKREFREILARVKDFFMTIIKPKPTYLGEYIPISGNGNITNDK